MANLAIRLPAKFNTTVGVDITKFPTASLDYLIEYGLKQKIASDLSDPDLSLDEATEKVDSIIERLKAGEIHTSGGREADPIKAEMKRLAIVAVKDALRTGGKKLKDFEDQMPQLIEKYLAKYETATREKAEANVALRESAPKADLSELI